MASNVYFKSLIWLVSLGSIGYGLLVLTEPSEKKLKEIRETSNRAFLNEDQLKKLQFIKRLREASGEDTKK